MPTRSCSERMCAHPEGPARPYPTSTAPCPPLSVSERTSPHSALCIVLLRLIVRVPARGSTVYTTPRVNLRVHTPLGSRSRPASAVPRSTSKPLHQLVGDWCGPLA